MPKVFIRQIEILGVQCFNVGNSYRCGSCPPGLTGDGRRGNCRVARVGCNSNPCFEGVACADTTEGFRCGSCPKGYEGNGTHCRDINEVCFITAVLDTGDTVVQGQRILYSRMHFFRLVLHSLTRSF